MPMSAAGYRASVSVRRPGKRLIASNSTVGCETWMTGVSKSSGRAREDRAKALERWLGRGPRHAEVSAVEVEQMPLQGIAGFVVRR